MEDSQDDRTVEHRRMDVDRARFRAGDDDHFSELVGAFGDLVMDVAKGFADDADEAHDFAQEAWIRVYRSRSTYRGGQFRTWLLVVARNVCRDAVRRRRRYSEVLANLSQDAGAEVDEMLDPLDRLCRHERRALLDKALTDLPQRQREAILMRLSDTRSTKDIASEMGIKPASVRSLISKGVAALADRFRQSGDAVGDEMAS